MPACGRPRRQGRVLPSGARPSAAYRGRTRPRAGLHRARGGAQSERRARTHVQGNGADRARAVRGGHRFRRPRDPAEPARSWDLVVLPLARHLPRGPWQHRCRGRGRATGGTRTSRPLADAHNPGLNTGPHKSPGRSKSGDGQGPGTASGTDPRRASRTQFALRFRHAPSGDRYADNAARPTPATGRAGLAPTTRQAVDRRAAVPEYEWRSGAGVLRRRDVEEIITGLSRVRGCS